MNFDYIIVGAGASGLQLAYRMANDAFFNDKSILIVDKQKKIINDRTWCFWEKNEGSWDDVLETTWKNIIFKSNTIHKQVSIKPYQYKMIRSANFYHKIWNVLDKKDNITFVIGDVKSIRQEKEIAKVTTSENVYTSKNVINSILFTNAHQHQEKYPVLQQHFVGFFVKTQTNIFDDTTATFMDFSIEQKGNTRFMYILPYSKNEALFEYTLFSKDFLEYETYTMAIKDYLDDKNVSDYEIVEVEKGAIPMTSYKFWKHNSKNIIHIGTAGGWSKASTGFTFKNIDKKTKKLITYLKVNKPLNKFHKKTKFWFYDLLLLDILSSNNQLGAEIFSQMFRRNSVNIIFKFLDEETSLIEDISIFSKMQIALFSKALFKRIFRI